MKNVENLISLGKLEPLRQGLVKKTYKYGDVVIGLVKVNDLDIHDRDPIVMRDSVRKYVDGLQDAGVPIVDVIEIGLQGSNLVMVTKFMPQFLDLAMKSGEVDFTNGSNIMLKDIGKTKNTNIGIDPTPKNFTFSKEEILYADFFYPITREYSNWKKNRMVLDTPRRQWIYFAQDYFYYPHVFSHTVCDLSDVGIQSRDQTFQLVSDFCQKNNYDFNLKESLNRFLEVRTQYGQQKG